MAYIVIDMVPGLRIYSAGRKPEGNGKAFAEYDDCVVSDRIMAWGCVEFCPLGAVLRSAAGFVKICMGQSAGIAA